MLGSAHEGERAVAALKATEILREAGLSWEVVVSRGVATASPSFTQPAGAPRPAQETAQRNHWRQQRPVPPRRKTRNGLSAWQAWHYLDLKRCLLSDWENQFLNSMAHYGPSLALTDKQWAVIDNMLTKVSRYAA